MNMEERIAAAIDAQLGDDHESLSVEMGCGSRASAWRKEAMQKAARAAIEAMREPTEEMIYAADPDGSRQLIWAQMIEAALAETDVVSKPAPIAKQPPPIEPDTRPTV